ncbi:MAG: RIP metalloprotease RseP [Oceanospirillaceae bacterium]|nr:RIP metalloprotease RseP [Oceanospirillaceae bacterium]
MDFIQTVIAFVVTLGVLVTIHEWGHFIVARLCGVKVLRFSVGFGKVLFSREDKKGTEFALAAIPLGGYVKMLDEREGDVDPAQKHMAFNNKNVWQRIAIVAAGPAVNLIFAVLVYWMLFVSGVSVVAPIIGGLEENSVAEHAQLPIGAEIVGLDGQSIHSWQDVNLALASRIGESGGLTVKVKGGEGNESFHVSQYTLQLERWNVDLENQSPINALGLIPFRPNMPAVLANIAADGQARSAGLLEGDKVVSISGRSISTWRELVEEVQASPQLPLIFEVERDNSILKISITPAQKKLESGRIVGYIGTGVVAPQWPPEMLRLRQLSVGEGLVAGAQRTWKMMTLTLDSIKKMFEGIISVKNLSGPITIAKVASASAESGFEAYLGFLAYLSISLGILNLLPIPMLDGGHLFYYAIEVIRRKPVSERIQGIGLRIGMALLFGMMSIAMFNDLMRL